MVIGRPAFSRAVPLMLFAGAILLLALVLVSLRFANQTHQNSNDALEAAGLNDRARLLFSLMQDAETSQRGYLITGEEKYLAPFKRSEALVNLQFTSITGDMMKLGISDVTIGRLKRLVDDKLAEMRRTIALKAAGRDTDAIAVVHSDTGKLSMDEIREIMTRIDAVTHNISFQKSMSLDNAVWWLLISITGGAVLLVILVGGAVYLAVAHARQLEAARNALAEHNGMLEVRIGQRTQFLERANRELQSYSYIVGHDLRAPLVNIMGFTSELERAAGIFAGYMKKPPAARDAVAEKVALEAVDVDIPEALGFIRSSMRRMDDLINEILRLARAGSRQLGRETIDLAALLAETVANLQHRLDESGASVVFSPSLPHVVSDRLALQQIFGNLLDNAIKYADPSRKALIHVSGTVNHGNAAIEVRDNGRGIAERDRERIFELFRRSGPQDRPGEGIGLAHVRALVRRLGGDVVVQSVLGQGTTFLVTFAADIRATKSRGET
ncbi:sensor histidine kinase [Rhizobium sp. PL01]|uniref:sensor histidine kinase n=1 Tax=Rhizobium sp. PL01 TaxID=3085631 RepID=UPI002981E481|nr:ATP-binding protein [Rhizobium sp. PL01]MDW5314059.1 CHASE3 domain-containing protein [Rhizobium sp. PL01]